MLWQEAGWRPGSRSRAERDALTAAGGENLLLSLTFTQVSLGARHAILSSITNSARNSCLFSKSRLLLLLLLFSSEEWGGSSLHLPAVRVATRTLQRWRCLDLTAKVCTRSAGISTSRGSASRRGKLLRLSRLCPAAGGKERRMETGDGFPQVMSRSWR